jgi:membrane protein required for colicin V production
MSIDIVYFLLLSIALIKGSRKGLIVAVFSMVGLVIGLVVALKLSGAVADMLKNEFSQLGFWAPAVAFALVFFGVFLLIRLVAGIVETAVSAIQLGWLNTLGGAAMYAAMTTLTYSVFLFFGKQMHLIGQSAIDASFTYSFIAPWGPKTIEGLSFVFPSLKNLFYEMEAFFQHLSEKTSK